MRVGRLLGVPVRINPMALPMIAAALFFGEGRSLALTAACVTLHELGHLAAARAVGARVCELELLPFGGAARLGDVWLLRPAQILLVALAGPCVNLLLAALSALLCEGGLLDACWTAEIIRLNLIVLVFNLLPALPLDGGRVLCALLALRASPLRAARTGAWLGRALAAALLALSAYTALSGRWNVTYALTGAYLLVSAARETRLCAVAPLESLASRGVELKREGTLPVRYLAVHADASARDTAAKLSPRRVYRLIVCDSRMRVLGEVSEERLFEALLAGGSETMERIARAKKAAAGGLRSAENA